MNPHQIAAYQTAHHNETALLTNKDQGLIDSHQRAVAAGLRLLRDGDHALAILDSERRDARLKLQVGDDHAQALLDNLPCELCGHREAHPNHRGIGHTHTPAEDRVSRAALLLNTQPDAAEYIAASARMMLGSRNPGEIVDMDHAEALADDLDRTVIGDLASTGAWVPVRELGHPAHPHLLRPTECTHCGRPIFVRYDSHGGFESAAHYA